MSLNSLEREVLDKFLTGDHLVLATLRAQVVHCRVLRRAFNVNGFSTDLEVGADAPRVVGNFELGGVYAEMPGLEHGAGFDLFVRDGRLSMLDGYAFVGPWPTNAHDVSLTYVKKIREADIARLR